MRPWFVAGGLAPTKAAMFRAIGFRKLDHPGEEGIEARLLTEEMKAPNLVGCLLTGYKTLSFDRKARKRLDALVIFREIENELGERFECGRGAEIAGVMEIILRALPAPDRDIAKIIGDHLPDRLIHEPNSSLVTHNVDRMAHRGASQQRQ
jgi:hypothetical protein